MIERVENTELSDRTASSGESNRPIPPRRKRRFRVPDTVLFLGPLTTVMILVIGFPLGYAVYLSFSEWSIFDGLQFIGLDNYREVLSNPGTGRALLHTLFFALGTTIGELILGLGAALLLNQQIKAQRWWRLALLLPWVIPPVVAAMTWKWLLHPEFGAWNHLLIDIGLLDEYRSWLGDPSTALPMVTLVSIWRGYPFVALILLAGLQTIPRDLYEVAAVDGAGPVRRFWHVTVPGLRYLIVLVTTLTTIWAIKQFDLVEVLTGGGPVGSSEVGATYVYRLFFEYQEFGESAAMAVLLLLAIFVVSWSYVRAVGGDDSE